MSTPMRIKLSRRRHFNLQAHSHALNGLPAIAVTRGKHKPFGNPYRVIDYLKFNPHATEQEAAKACVESFKAWLEETDEGQAMKALAKEKLRGKNLACFCPLDFNLCHAEVLMIISNEP